MKEEVVMNVKLKIDKSDLEKQLNVSIGKGGGNGKGGLLSGIGDLFGGGKSAGGGAGGGIGALAGKLGFIGVALNQIAELTGKVFKVLEDASPSFKATASMFKTSIMLCEECAKYRRTFYKISLLIICLIFTGQL